MAYSRDPWKVQSQAPEILLRNVRIVDAAKGSVSEPTNVLIANGLFETISESISSTSAAQIDLKGKFICPGLIDCHVHTTAAPGSAAIRDMFDEHPDTLAYRTAWNVKQMLLRGFTTVRDTGGASYALRNAIAEHLIPGPRMFISGKALSQTGGHGDFRQAHQNDSFKCCSGHVPSLTRVCDGVPHCLETVRDELRMGADFIKIMVGGGVASPADPLEMLQFTPEEIRAITQTASYLGTYVTAHAYTVDSIRHAIDNGVLGIEHGNFIDEATARLCAAKGVFVTPTLITYKAILSPPYEKFLPPQGVEKCHTVTASGVKALKIMHEAGVTLCFGTDLLAGMHARQNEEFEIRSEALPAAEILKSTTINAARLLRMENKIGTISEGAYADFLILDANPLEDITILNKMEKHCFAIAKEGRVVMSKLIDEGMKIDVLYQ